MMQEYRIKMKMLKMKSLSCLATISRNSLKIYSKIRKNKAVPQTFRKWKNKSIQF